MHHDSPFGPSAGVFVIHGTFQGLFQNWTMTLKDWRRLKTRGSWITVYVNNPLPADSSCRLDLDNFWDLLFVARISSSLALIINIVIFLYQQRQVLKQFDSKDSIWTRICVMLRIFDQKDLREKTPQDSRKAPDVGVTRAPSPTFQLYGSPTRPRSSFFWDLEIHSKRSLMQFKSNLQGLPGKGP